MPKRINQPYTKSETQAALKPTASAVSNEALLAKRNKQLTRGTLKSNPLAVKLAQEIQTCTKTSRCGRASCPVCSKKHKKIWSREARNFFNNGKPVYWVTLIPSMFSYEGYLTLQDYEQIKPVLTSMCVEARLESAAGVLDLSLNGYEGYQGKFYYVVHPTLFFQTNDLAHVKRVFKKYFPATNQTPRPVLIKKIDMNPRVFKYAHKTEFKRRLHVPATETKRRTTSKQSLKIGQMIEVMGILSEMRLQGRIFLHNLRFTKNPTTGKLELVKRPLRGIKQ